MSRSSGQGSEHLSSEGHKSDGYVSVEEKQPSARVGMKDYEGRRCMCFCGSFREIMVSLHPALHARPHTSNTIFIING